MLSIATAIIKQEDFLKKILLILIFSFKAFPQQYQFVITDTVGKPEEFRKCRKRILDEGLLSYYYSPEGEILNDHDAIESTKKMLHAIKGSSALLPSGQYYGRGKPDFLINDDYCIVEKEVELCKKKYGYIVLISSINCYGGKTFFYKNPSRPLPHGYIKAYIKTDAFSSDFDILITKKM